ncbi:probable chitinase 10 [Musca autumnalis]|uniref:probable chitinase 10 n=1 Tax=Musca autumnalis TaxID=221902 RepID=UPI003CF1DAB1
MLNLKLISLLVVASLGATVVNAKKMVNCYYGTWANYRSGDGHFEAANIDPMLCTHISYSFFGIDPISSKFKSLDDWLDNGLGMIKKTMELKKLNPDLKVLAVVGGWNEGSDKFSAMARDPSRRRAFIDSAVAFIKQYGFDGLDIDWEYPAQREGSSPQDKQNFVTLLKELKEALSPLHLELGIAVGASASTAAISYDIPNISKYVDFINIMTYDFHSTATLSYNSPLKGQGENNVESAVKYWLNSGAPASKLIMGLAFYGRHFGYSSQPMAGAPQLGAGTPGPYTQQPGFMGYNEICQLSKSGYNFKFDDTHGVPYAFNGNQWIGFDDAKSIAMKVQLANSLNLGGVMVWSLESDDFLGTCGEKYALLKAINNALGGESNGETNTKPQQTIPTKKPEVVVTAPPNTNKPSENVSSSGCSSDGTFVNESDCGRFYQCASGMRFDYDCPPGLKFDSPTSTCTWPDSANCAKKMVNCYYGTSANYRPGDGKFVASNIDPMLCTHISYSFFGIDPISGQFKSLDKWLDMGNGLGMIKKTMELKTLNPDLKVLAVVGGWNEGSGKFSAMAADPNKRRTFIDSAVAFIKQHGFDGLDIDREYPVQREGSSPEDKQNFVTFLKELKEALSPLNLELGIAVGASTTAAISYDIPNISKYVDFINIITYDFHDSATLSYNSPLKGQGENNVESAVKYWLNAGAPASKLIMGLAFYGRHFGYSSQPMAGEAQLGAGSPGPYSKQPGFMGYNEICQLSKSGYNFKFDDAHGVPYAYNDNQWIGFDDAKSIAMKVQLANSLNLGGVMVRSLESDDFRGTCGEEYVLLKAINNTLDDEHHDKTNKPSQNVSGECNSDGIFANESDCSRFYQCAGGIRFEHDCPPGLKFDIPTSKCTWAYNANCGN